MWKKLLILICIIPGIANALEISTSSTNLGIGTTSTVNQLGVVGGLAVGSTAVNTTSPIGGIIIDGNVGIGSVNPFSKLDVQGLITETIDHIALHPSHTISICTSNGGAVIGSRGFAGCDYVATGTNDDVVFNAAGIKASSFTNGAKIFVAEGVYNISASIQTTQNTWWDGAGIGKTVLKGQSGLGTKAIFDQLSAGYTSVSPLTNFEISNMEMDGTSQGSGAYNAGKKSVFIQYLKRAIFQNLYLHNNPATCLGVDMFFDGLIDHVIVDSCGTAGNGGASNGSNGIGIGTDATVDQQPLIMTNNIASNCIDYGIGLEELVIQTNTPTKNIVIANNISFGNYYGYDVTGSGYVNVEGNIGYNNTNDGFYLRPDYNPAGGQQYANPPVDVIISGNHFYNNGNAGMELLIDATYIPTHFNISNNIVDGNTFQGVITKVDYADLIDNQIYNNGQEGIDYRVANASFMKINGNTILNNGTSSTSGHTAGINVDVVTGNTLKHLEIRNNTINDYQGSKTQTYAVNLINTGTITNFILQNNDLSGNLTGAYTNSGPTIITNTYSFNNLGESTLGSNFAYGNVGIGSPAPGQVLDVNGTVRATYFVGNGAGLTGISGSGTVNSGTAGQVAYYATSTTAVSGTNNLYISGSNVGIGSVTPGQILDVQGTTRIYGNVGINASTSPARLYVAQDSGNTANSGSEVINSGATGTIRNWVDSSGNAHISNGSADTGIISLNGNGGASAGNVGIGTIITNRQLQITGALGTSASIGLEINNLNGRRYSLLSFGSASATSPNSLSVFDATSAATRMLIDVNGNVGINSTAPGTVLDVTGSVRISSGILNTGITTDVTKTDATLCEDTTSHLFYSGSGTLGICLGTSTQLAKQNIVPIGEGLPQVMALKPVSFNYRPGWGFDPKKPYYGFLAEDVDHVLPRLVGRNDKGIVRNADYVGMIPVMVKSIQQQQIEIDNSHRVIMGAFFILFCFGLYLRIR